MEKGERFTVPSGPFAGRYVVLNFELVATGQEAHMFGRKVRGVYAVELLREALTTTDEERETAEAIKILGGEDFVVARVLLDGKEGRTVEFVERWAVTMEKPEPKETKT